MPSQRERPMRFFLWMRPKQSEEPCRGKSSEFTNTYTVSKAATYGNTYGGEGAVYLDADLNTPSYGRTFDSDEMTIYVQ